MTAGPVSSLLLSIFFPLSCYCCLLTDLVASQPSANFHLRPNRDIEWCGVECSVPRDWRGRAVLIVEHGSSSSRTRQSHIPCSVDARERLRNLRQTVFQSAHRRANHVVVHRSRVVAEGNFI